MASKKSNNVGRLPDKKENGGAAPPELPSLLPL